MIPKASRRTTRGTSCLAAEAGRRSSSSPAPATSRAKRSTCSMRSRRERRRMRRFRWTASAPFSWRRGPTIAGHRTPPRCCCGRALVIASDLDNKWSDFPLHATFVPFVHEAVRYLASARAHASDYLVADAPAGVQKAPGFATIGDGRAGPFGSLRAGGTTRRIAVNVDPREADPARLSVEEFTSAVTQLKDAGASEARVEARQQEDRQHLWQYAMACMALLLVAEGLLAARTA